MEIKNDILLDENNDLKITGGDFAVGDSFEQDVKLILSLTKGSLKSDPVLGTDLIRLINSGANETEIIQKIRLNLQRDDKKVGKINFDNGTINIEPKK